ncbi:hypothetical protein [Halobellus captivus]|uniref:hypothetical protein n=1 Tax=Halobellus captivus TaxID=2592614 RepID=UPI00119EFBD1|nr:hypothetical protein [Halobellus captivus]
MQDFLLSRRHLLASGLAVGITASAGCLEFGNNTPRGDTGMELTLSLTRVDEPLRNRYVHGRGDPDDRWDEQALEAALNDEQYTTQLRRPFFARPEDPAYAVHEGIYYQLNSVIVDEITETYPVLRLFESEGSTATPVDGGENGDLPESDHRAVHIAHMAARARGNEGGYPSGLVQRGGYVYRSEAARDESDLLAEGDPDHVTYRETTYEVEITHEQFYEAVYRPTAEPVTEDPDRMETILRATLVGARTSQDDLSSEVQRIITEAETDGYSETHPFSEAYEELLRAMDKRPYIDGNIRKDAGVRTNEKEMIQYGDTYYEYYLRLNGGSDG